MTSLPSTSTAPIPQTLVLGIGNAWRGDDAAGLLAAHALRARDLPGVTVVETNVVDPALIESWQRVDRLIVVDAVVSGAAPGTVHRFDLSRETLPATLSFCSTHVFDLAALLDLARALGRLPQQVWVFGIEARDFTHGRPVSEEVMLGLNACVEAIVRVLYDTSAQAAMPDVHHPTVTLIGEGALVAAHLPMEGTFTNPLMGIPPNGQTVSVWMTNLWRMADGKAAEWWISMDTLGFMRQIGAIPPMG